MKATLKFELPEERSEFEMASQSGFLYDTLSDIDERCRRWQKDGVPGGPLALETVLQEIRDRAISALTRVE